MLNKIISYFGAVLMGLIRFSFIALSLYISIFLIGINKYELYKIEKSESRYENIERYSDEINELRKEFEALKVKLKEGQNNE